MKLTWFGGTTLRIYLGGMILVIDAASAPEGIDRAELVSGADQVVEGFGAALGAVDPATWRPRKPARMIGEEADTPLMQAWKAGDGAILVEAIGEPPLLLARGRLPALGRWAGEAVVVLFGDGAQMSALGEQLLGGTQPQLIGLAGGEQAVDAAIGALRDQLDGAGLVALEAGLALEV